MTSPVAPPAAPTVPTYPALGSPSFNAEAYAVGTAMPSVVDGIEALAECAYTNAVSAHEGATAAQHAAGDASTVAGQAMASANFKGMWATLIGSLSKPASVKHSGRVWLLLNNLADVTASEPGPSNPDWTVNDQGTVPSAYITSNTTVVPGIRYIVGAAGITLSMAGVTWLKGDYFGVREVIGSGTYTIEFGTTKDRGQTRGTYLVTAGYRQLDRTYEDATRGLI